MKGPNRETGVYSGPSPATGAAAANFDEILQTYYHAWFRYHPEAAVEVGVPGYADKLTPYDDDDMGALRTLHEEILGSIDELNTGELDPDRRIDCQVVYGAAFIELEELFEEDWRRRDPGGFLPINAIYQLTVRPVEDFADALLSRLDAISNYLRGARQFLSEKPETIPPVWLDSAVTEARRGVEYLRSLPNDPKVMLEAKKLRGMEGRIGAANEALLGYADFLETEISPRAKGDFACRKKRFEHLLQYRHFLDIDTDRLHQFGQDLFEQTQRELKDVCRELHGDDDLAAMTARIQADHPASGHLLAAYREQMQAAREFVGERGLVSLPEAERLDVVETPVFLRHQIPFAAYMEPPPNDPAQHGYYYVTPADTEELLREHNNPGLMHTCVHEAWPGHHLQFVTANLNPVSRGLPRLLNPSATLYEGWALYCEQMMHDEGFLDRPEQRFILLKDRLWRALRIIIDVEIHTRGVSLDEAAARMVKHLGFPKAQAMADLTWYSQAPTVPLGYATGWALINAVRDRVRLGEQGDFTLRSFHDRLLSTGSVALPLAIQRVFGKEVWKSARAMVFGND